MLKFVIGVDPRTKLGGDLERAFTCDYGMQLADFEIRPLHTPRTLITRGVIQAELKSILRQLYASHKGETEAFVAIASGTAPPLIKRAHAPSLPVTAIEIIDGDGCECCEMSFYQKHYLPWREHIERHQGKKFDLVDKLATAVVESTHLTSVLT